MRRECVGAKARATERLKAPAAADGAPSGARERASGLSAARTRGHRPKRRKRNRPDLVRRRCDAMRCALCDAMRPPAGAPTPHMAQRRCRKQALGATDRSERRIVQPYIYIVALHSKWHARHAPCAGCSGTKHGTYTICALPKRCPQLEACGSRPAAAPGAGASCGRFLRPQHAARCNPSCCDATCCTVLQRVAP